MAFNDTFIALINKVTRKQVFILSLVISIITGAYYIAPHMITYADNVEARKERKYLEELRIKNEFKKQLDSIEKLRRTELSELFIYKNNAIQDQMSFLERGLPNTSHITIFSIHNGGGVPKTGGEAKISILYTTDNVKGVDMLKEYANYPLYSGYAEYAYQMLTRKGKSYYVEDVENYPDIYQGQTKNNMDYLGTRSMFGVWIKSSPVATYYITANFQQPNGMDLGERGVKETLVLNAKDQLQNLLDTEIEIK